MRPFSPLFILIFFSYFVFEILADSKFISCVYNAKNIISGRKICSQRLYLGHAAYSSYSAWLSPRSQRLI